MSILRAVCFLSVFTAGVASALAATVTDPGGLERQRADFKLAWSAAQKGDLAVLTPYLDELKDYPLAPYLRYAYLKATLDVEPDPAVLDFIKQQAGLPLSDELRRAWILSLGKRRQWNTVLAQARYDNDPALRCVVVAAHLITGDAAEHAMWTPAAQRLWLTPVSPADSCLPLFAYLQSRHLINGDLERRRAQALLQARDWAGARALLPGLTPADREWVQTWLDLADDPARLLEEVQVPDEPRYQEMLLAGIRLVARNEPLRAQHLLTVLGARYRFSHDDRRDLRTLIALQHAWHLMPDARAQLKHLKDAVDPQVPEWRTRLALRDGDWRETLADIERLGADADTEEWRYWKARALSKLGRDQDARWLYRQLAHDTDYYGFLAADHLQQPYVIAQEASAPAPMVLGQLEQRAGILRARELFYVGLYPEAEAEWSMATAKLSATARCQSALLADHWGWHARAIPELASGECWRDLERIYPIAFQEMLAPRAQALQLDLSWVYGLIRSESVFRPNAVSQSGALGLMQLMPGTGRDVATHLGLNVDADGALLDPLTNLAIGSRYMFDMLKRFKGSEPLATAAYNAGPTRVEDWLPDAGDLPADVWVDTIPYTQTRNYVHRVLGHTVIFDWRLNGKAQPLSARLGVSIGTEPDTGTGQAAIQK